MDALLDIVLAKYGILADELPSQQQTLFNKHPADWTFDDEQQQIDQQRRERKRRALGVRRAEVNAELRALADETQSRRDIA